MSVIYNWYDEDAKVFNFYNTRMINWSIVIFGKWSIIDRLFFFFVENLRHDDL